MGDAMSDPNFMLPIDVLALLVKGCLTRGVENTQMYSTTSRFQSHEQHIPLPDEEARYIFTKHMFTCDLLNKQYNDSVAEIVVHLSWGDLDNSRWFIEELMNTITISRTQLSQLEKPFKVLRQVLMIRDMYEETRIEMVFKIEKSL